MGDLTETQFDCFALSQQIHCNIVSAKVVYQKLRANITLEVWKRSARLIRASWPLAALPDSLDPEP